MMVTMHVGCCTDELSMLSLAEAAYSTVILFHLPCNFQDFSAVPTLSEAALATVTVPSTSRWILQISRPPVPGSRSHVGLCGWTLLVMQPQKSIGSKRGQQ